MRQKIPVNVFIFNTVTILNPIILDPSFPSKQEGRDIVISFRITRRINKKSHFKI
jgi:hypothetical protein